MMGALLASSAALGVGAAAVAHGIFAPRSRLFCPVISWGDRGGRPRIALTFDDGPWPGATEGVLDELGQAGVWAAFFVIGAHARRWPDLVRRIDAEGHIVCNHSDEHSHWGARRHKRYWRLELDRASDAIEDAIGKRPLLFRPPLGYKNWLMAAAARERGIETVTWSNRGMDGVLRAPERIASRVLRNARAGQIVVLHDGVDPRRSRDPSVTVAAIGPILAGLTERGLACERLDRLIGLPAYAAGVSVMESAALR